AEARGPTVAAPAAIALLGADEPVKGGLAILPPGDAVRRFGVGEELGPAVLAQRIDGLGVVVVRVLIVADAGAGSQRGKVLPAEDEPLLDKGRVVLAGREATAD